MMLKNAFVLAPLAILLAGCPAKKDDGSSANVHDDVWVSSNAGPVRVLVDGDTGWVVNLLANSVDVIDLTTCGTGQASCDPIGTTLLGTGAGPFDGVIAAGRLHLVLSGASQVVSIDTATRSVVATITTGAGALYSPQAVAVANGDLFIADSNFYGSGPGFVAMVAGTAITGSITTTQLQPGAFSVLPDGNLAVTNTGYVEFGETAVATSSGGIDIVDPALGTVVDNIDLGLVAPVGRVVVQGNIGYVVSGTEGTLLRVDMTAGTFEEIEVTATASFLTWVEIVDGKLYVLSSNEDLIYVFDAATTAPLDTIRIGPGGDTNKAPSHIAVWEDGDGVKHLLIAMFSANSVTDVVLE